MIYLNKVFLGLSIKLIVCMCGFLHMCVCVYVCVSVCMSVCPSVATEVNVDVHKYRVIVRLEG